MSGDAYYIPGESSSGKQIPKGEYRAHIIGLDINKNVKCGDCIADIFKPIYRLELKGADTQVRDSGIFRYKERDGYEFKSNRNWGFAKFCEILGLKKENNGIISLPYLEANDIDSFHVVIEVSHKSFINETGNQISYPVARLKSIITEAPF